MRICCVDAPVLAEAFRRAGYDVLSIRPRTEGLAPHGLLDLATHAPLRDFAPQLLLQQEVLGPRTLLKGVQSLDCVTAFWSIDTHLNSFWHRHYGRLFDRVFTNQPAWVERLAELGLPHMDERAILAMCAPERDCPPQASRDVVLGFVGRVTPERPIRQWMVEHLTETWGLQVESDLTHAQMLDFYGRCLLVPNEAIAGEVNFRLFEASSRGGLVLSPTTCRGQSHFFSPGEELAVFEDVHELDELLAYFSRKPEAAAAMGRAAWQRVQAEHLARHRAAHVVRVMESASQARATGAEAKRQWTATRTMLALGGMLDAMLNEVGDELVAMLAQADWRAFAMDALHALGSTAVVDKLVAEMASEGEHGTGHDDPHTNRAAACVALARQTPEGDRLARWFALRDAGALTGTQRPKVLSEPAGVYRYFARRMLKQGLEATLRPGFRFDETRHLPATQVELLLCAYAHVQQPPPNDGTAETLDIIRELDRALTPHPGMEAMRIGLLSHYTLHRPDDSRAEAELARLNAVCFRE